ncbi:MAG: hypothetical protein H8E71_06850 [Candidatus Marinimicrobia bacterium]|nr:hypothetical protein [Candidatus Neomarinimicrobiota bacterium]
MIRLIIDNLVSKGYTFDGEAEDGMLVFVHENRTPILLVEYEENLIGFISRYKINDRYKKDEKKLLQILNQLNRESVISKYSLVVDHDYKRNQVEIRATWLPFYSADIFNQFFHNWQFDNEKRILDADKIEDFLLLTRKSKIAG